MKPYSSDWWYNKGYADRREFRDPKFPKVKPYMEGWEGREDDDRDAYGDIDFMNQ